MPTEDSYPSEMSRRMAERLALPTGGYPDVWAMSQDEYDECYGKWVAIEITSQTDEKVIGRFLTPDQIEFRNALEARLDKEMEEEDREYDRECAELSRRKRIPVEKARKAVSKRWMKAAEKKWKERETTGERIMRVLAFTLFFPVALVWNMWKPGIFRECYPRTRSAVQAIGNWLMMSLLAFLLVFSPCVMVHPAWGMRQLFLILIVPTMLVMALYDPWYTMLSMIPFWILYAAVSAYRRASGTPPTTEWLSFWFWMWTIYPFVRGIVHILQWERERKAGLPNHRVAKHPMALTFTALLMMVGTHYVAKHGKNKKG